jgi:hypothetical protein
MDKTLKLRAYPAAAKSNVPQGNLAKDQNLSLELEKKNALLEDERSKTLELLKTIVQLRESLKQEQAKSADLEGKLNKLATVEENQLVKKSAQLEEEKKKSLEYMNTIGQLRESIKQNQAKMAEAERMSAGQEARTRELAELKAKVNDLTGVLGKISSIAGAGKLDSNG